MWEELQGFVHAGNKKEVKKILDCLEREVMYSHGRGEIPEECITLVEGIYTDSVCRRCEFLGRAVLSLGTDAELMSSIQRDRLRLIFEENVTEGLAGYLVDVAVDCFSRIYTPEQCYCFFKKIVDRKIEGVHAFVYMGLRALLSEGKISEQEYSKVLGDFSS